jgi:hypothetical protein
LSRQSVLGSVLFAQRLDGVDSHRALEMAKFLHERNPDLINDLKSKRPPCDRVGLTVQAKNETELEFVYRKVWEYMVSLTAKDCSLMISMQRVQPVMPMLAKAENRGSGMVSSSDDSESLESSSTDEDSDFEMVERERLSFENVIFDEASGLAFAVSVAVTDLDPKVPSSYAELMRKWSEKDYLMVAAFNGSQALEQKI